VHDLFLRGLDSLEHDAEFVFVLNDFSDFSVANHDRTMPLLVKKHSLKRPGLKRWPEDQFYKFPGPMLTDQLKLPKYDPSLVLVWHHNV